MAKRLSAGDVADLTFFTLTGQVQRSTVQSEVTHQWRPGVGYVTDPRTGQMVPNNQPTPVPKTRQRAYFTIRDQAGATTEVQAVGADVREGQIVSVVYAGDGYEAWIPVGLYNHDTRTKTYLELGIQAVRGDSASRPGCFALLAGVLVTLATLGLALVVLIPWMLGKSRGIAKAEAAIRSRVEEQLRGVALPRR